MTKFNANNVDDFMDAANKKYGGDNLGSTDAKPQSSKYNFKDGKITKLSFSCPIDMDYAEVGSGKPDAANKDAIAKVAAIAEAHEEKHKAGYEAAFKKWNADKVAKDLMSKSFDSQKEADKAVKDAIADLEKELKDACLALHKKEGIVEVTHEQDGSISVATKPAGASGCS